jgi:hypothetical protein
MDKSKLWICAVFVIFTSSVLSESIKPEEIERDTLVSSLPGFQDHFDAYQPQEALLQQLQSGNDFIRIEVFLDMECSLSQKLVPVLMKILEDSDNPYIEAEYYQGLDEEKNISKTPTFVVYRDSRELGRIVEQPLTSIEQDLVDILSAAPPPDYSLDYDFFMHNYHADLDVNCAECHLSGIKRIILPDR